MTKDEYKLYLSRISSKEHVAERKALFAQHRALAKEIQQYDPELARLVERNVDNGEEFYVYLKRKLDMN